MTTTPPAQERRPANAGESSAAAESAPRRHSATGRGSQSHEGPTAATRAVPGADRARQDGDTPRGEQRVRGGTGTTGTTGTNGAGRRLLGYRRQRFEARKVRRLIRHIDPWSMLKLSLLLSLCMWLIGMIASVILWTVARNAGTIESIEELVNSSLSLQNWSLDGEFIFRQFGVLSLLSALGLTAAVVVATLVFNLVSDIIGGVWVSVIEEETARPVAESNRPSGVS